MNILIVDDSALMRTFVREALDVISKDFEVFGAATGDAAMEHLARMPFDLVLCDWNMPRMDGGDLLRWVRSNEQIKDTPFIMLTAHDDKELIMKMIKLGVKDYIIKPVSVEALTGRIKKVLYGR